MQQRNAIGEDKILVIPVHVSNGVQYINKHRFTQSDGIAVSKLRKH